MAFLKKIQAGARKQAKKQAKAKEAKAFANRPGERQSRRTGATVRRTYRGATDSDGASKRAAAVRKQRLANRVADARKDAARKTRKKAIRRVRTSYGSS